MLLLVHSRLSCVSCCSSQERPCTSQLAEVRQACSPLCRSRLSYADREVLKSRRERQRCTVSLPPTRAAAAAAPALLRLRGQRWTCRFQGWPARRAAQGWPARRAAPRCGEVLVAVFHRAAREAANKRTNAEAAGAQQTRQAKKKNSVHSKSFAARGMPRLVRSYSVALSSAVLVRRVASFLERPRSQ